MTRRSALAAALTLMLSAGSLNADRGGIPYFRHVTVYEPGQKAIVAWNAGREALILTTDVRASHETKVLEIMPFPAEPTVAEAHHVSFVYLEYLVNRAIRELLIAQTPTFRGGGPGEQRGIDIVSHQTIGAHAVTVIKVQKPDEVRAWVTDFLAKEAPQARLPEGLPKLLTGYHRDGYAYFAFDVITVGPDVRSVQPLSYTFKSPCIFYPMRISSLYDSTTEITLATVTRTPIPDERMQAGFQRMTFSMPDDRPFTAADGQRRFVIPPVHLEKKHLTKLSPKVAPLFPRGRAVLTMWKYTGTLNVATDVAIRLDGK